MGNSNLQLTHAPLKAVDIRMTFIRRLSVDLEVEDGVSSEVVPDADACDDAFVRRRLVEARVRTGLLRLPPPTLRAGAGDPCCAALTVAVADAEFAVEGVALVVVVVVAAVTPFPHVPSPPFGKRRTVWLECCVLSCLLFASARWNLFEHVEHWKLFGVVCFFMCLSRLRLAVKEKPH